jgi:hypothetical protein
VTLIVVSQCLHGLLPSGRNSLRFWTILWECYVCYWFLEALVTGSR